MLTPEYLESLPEPVVKLWQQVEDDILRDIARRIGKMDSMTETADFQLWRLEEIRTLRKSVTSTLAKYSGKTEQEIRNLLQSAGKIALDGDDAVYAAAGYQPGPLNDSVALLNLLNAGYAQTIGTWDNLTATTANTVTREFEHALDRAWLQVSSGAFDYKTAIKRAVDGLAQHMPGVTYPSGHHDTLEVAVRRAVLTGINQTASKLQLARMDEFAWDWVEVSAHSGARPEHAAWQGKLYHRGGAAVYQGKRYEDFETATGYGTGAGLCGWNCRHTFFASSPDNPPAWSPEDLAALSEKTINYNGEKYTKYEISQMQRSLERKVRSAKRKYMAEAEAGIDATRAAVELKNKREELKQFIAETHRRIDSSRTSVSGFGHSAAAKATAAANRQKRYGGVPLQEERAWVAGTKRNQSGKVQKLNFAQETTKEDQMNIEQELSLLPQDIREKAETMISEIRVKNGIGGNGYNPKTQEILLSDEREWGAVIHEYGHALERAFDLRHDPAFIAVRKEGLALEDSAQTVYDRDTFTKPIWRIKSDKFISVYQGRIYPHPKYYIYTPDRKRINDMYLLDYFSEGFRAFYLETELLKQKDPKLYDFIARLSDDKK